MSSSGVSIGEMHRHGLLERSPDAEVCGGGAAPGGWQAADSGGKPAADGVEELFGGKLGHRGVDVRVSGEGQGHVAGADECGTEPDLAAAALLAGGAQDGQAEQRTRRQEGRAGPEIRG